MNDLINRTDIKQRLERLRNSLENCAEEEARRGMFRKAYNILKMETLIKCLIRGVDRIPPAWPDWCNEDSTCLEGECPYLTADKKGCRLGGDPE